MQIMHTVRADSFPCFEIDFVLHCDLFTSVYAAKIFGGYYLFTTNVSNLT